MKLNHFYIILCLCLNGSLYGQPIDGNVDDLEKLIQELNDAQSSFDTAFKNLDDHISSRSYAIGYLSSEDTKMIKYWTYQEQRMVEHLYYLDDEQVFYVTVWNTYYTEPMDWKLNSQGIQLDLEASNSEIVKV